MCNENCSQGRDCKCLDPASTGWVYWAILMAIIIAIMLVSEWHDERDRARMKHAERMAKVAIDANRACRDGIQEGCAAMTAIVVSTVASK